MFITLEGPDGSGKTTQMELLAEFLRSRGLVVYQTREPGGTAIGDQIRTVLFDHKNKAMVPHTEILLFLASRAQHTAEIIRPRLEAGEVVICDRYRDSTIAYQGYGHGVDLAVLHQLNDFATQGLVPDLTLLFDIDAEAGIQRRASGGDWNRLDAYAMAFHKKVRDGYLHMAAQAPGRWSVINAGQPVEAVQAEVRQAVASRLV